MSKLAIFLFTTCFFCQVSYGSPYQEKIFEDAKEWVRSQLRLAKKEFTKENGTEETQENLFEGKLLIFVSFSMPDNIWLELSQEAKKYGAILVVRGLPKNSFVVFSKKLLSLRKKGMDADVDIDPEAFQKYKIKQVPSFVIEDSKNYDKVSGNISLGYFLERASSMGDSILAKHLLKGEKQ